MACIPGCLYRFISTKVRTHADHVPWPFSFAPLERPVSPGVEVPSYLALRAILETLEDVE